jgi:hypothetical protein
MSDDPRFEVHDHVAEKFLKEIGLMLGRAVPPGYGFTLLLFSFGPGGHMFYTSNANRDDMVRAMREFIAKQGPQ